MDWWEQSSNLVSPLNLNRLDFIWNWWWNLIEKPISNPNNRVSQLILSSNISFGHWNGMPTPVSASITSVSFNPRWFLTRCVNKAGFSSIKGLIIISFWKAFICHCVSKLEEHYNSTDLFVSHCSQITSSYFELIQWSVS